MSEMERNHDPDGTKKHSNRKEEQRSLQTSNERSRRDKGIEEYPDMPHKDKQK